MISFVVQKLLSLIRSHLFFVFFFKRTWSFFFFNLFMVVLGLRFCARALSSCGHSSSQCTGLSLSWPLLLRSTGSRRAGSVIMAHGPSCSAACGIFPDQGSNPCTLHWQADSQPLRHQGSPPFGFLFFIFVFLGGGSKKILLRYMSKSVLPMFSL